MYIDPNGQNTLVIGAGGVVAVVAIVLLYKQYLDIVFSEEGPKWPHRPWGPFPKPADEPVDLPVPRPTLDECIEKCWKILEKTESTPGKNTSDYERCLDDCKRGKDCSGYF